MATPRRKRSALEKLRAGTFRADRDGERLLEETGASTLDEAFVLAGFSRAAEPKPMVLVAAIGYAPRRYRRAVARAFEEHPDLELAWAADAAEFAKTWSALDVATLAVSKAFEGWRQTHGAKWLREQGIPEDEILRCGLTLPGDETPPTVPPPDIDQLISLLVSGELLAWWQK